MNGVWGIFVRWFSQTYYIPLKNQYPIFIHSAIMMSLISVTSQWVTKATVPWSYRTTVNVVYTTSWMLNSVWPITMTTMTTSMKWIQRKLVKIIWMSGSFRITPHTNKDIERYFNFLLGKFMKEPILIKKNYENIFKFC